MVFLLLIPLALGALLLTLGLHGRRINTHPTCRKCRYDLHQLRNPTTCPECGRDLTRKRAIQLGARRRRRIPIALGTLICCLACSFLAYQSYVSLRNYDWLRILPFSMVIDRTDHPNVTTQQGAFAELTRRLTRKTLTPEQVARIVSITLAAQADKQQPWQHEWGDLLELARRQNQVPDTDWLRYARQSTYREILVRSPVAVGDPLVVLVDTHHRAAQRSVLSCYSHFRGIPDGMDPFRTVLRFEPEDIGLPRRAPRQSLNGGGRADVLTAAAFSNPNSSPVRAHLTDSEGVHQLVLTVDTTLLSGGSNLLQWSETLNCTVTVHESINSLIRLKSSAAERQSVQNSITQLATFLKEPFYYARPSGSHSESVERLMPPVQSSASAAFDIFGVAPDGREWLLGGTAIVNGTTYVVLRPIIKPAPYPLPYGSELNFRPSAEVAARLIGMNEIWGEEVRVSETADIRVPWISDSPDTPTYEYPPPRAR